MRKSWNPEMGIRAEVGSKEPNTRRAQEKNLMDLYVNKGYSLIKLKKKFNLPIKIIKKILKKNNIPIREFKKSSRKYDINDNYDGDELLNFLATIGYFPISTNRVIIELPLEKEDILKQISEELQYTGPLHYYESKVCLAFTSKPLRDKILPRASIP